MTEVWKDIPGYEGKYQASTLGRIRSLDQYVRCGNEGKGIRLRKGKVLRPGPIKTGHLYVAVNGRKGNGVPVHQLVARTFIGERPAGMDVCHNDGDPTNNRVENLRYDTRTNNILDVYKQGKRWRKLSALDVIAMRKLHREGRTATSLAEQYGISVGSACKAIKGDTFKWLQDT